MSFYRRNPWHGRAAGATAKSANPNEAIRKSLADYGITASDAEISAFRQWMITKRWSEYKEHYSQLHNSAKQSMDSTPIIIPNGTKGKPYPQFTFQLPTYIIVDKFAGLEGTGLEIVPCEEPNKYLLQGTPAVTGDVAFKIIFKFDGWVEGQPMPEREIKFAINPDPRSLWKNIPTSADVPYYKPDTDCEYVKVEASADGTPRKDIVAASQRGRSHANEGKARDDHFSVYHNPGNDWYILAVADGAGSAKFSRKGSWVACDTVMDYCKKQLDDSEAFEAAIRAYSAVKGDPEKEPAARKSVGDFVYNIVGKAAHLAFLAIGKAAEAAEAKPKDFATTLLLAICKKFDFGWFFATFWVGDGALCLYDKDAKACQLLGIPDEGEFSGQTRFLTMPEIFTDASAFYKRLRFGIKDDFTALMLMTDGVSDPMFGTDSNLNNIAKWDELWDKLSTGFPEDNIPGVDLSDDNELAKDQLLAWLSFWKPGEHDDRTIAILY